MKIDLITICKGHLLMEEEKCIKCPISKDNEKSSCYQACFMPREYNGHSSLYYVRMAKKMSLEDTQDAK